MIRMMSAEDILQELARIKELIADAFDHFKTTRAGPNSAARAFAQEVLVIAGALEELDSRINADNLSQALGFYAQRVVELADFIPRSMDPDGKFYGYREYHGQERIERIEHDIVWFNLKISELLSDLENRIVSEEEEIYDSMMYEDDLMRPPPKPEPVRPSFTANDPRHRSPFDGPPPKREGPLKKWPPKQRKRPVREKFSAPGERHYVSRPFGAKYKDSI